MYLNYNFLSCPSIGYIYTLSNDTTKPLWTNYFFNYQRFNYNRNVVGHYIFTKQKCIEGTYSDGLYCYATI